MNVFKTDLRNKTILNLAKKIPEGLLSEHDIFSNLFEGARVYVLTQKENNLSENGRYLIQFIRLWISTALNLRTALSFRGGDYGNTWLAYCDYSLKEAKAEYLEKALLRKGKE